MSIPSKQSCYIRELSYSYHAFCRELGIIFRFRRLSPQIRGNLSRDKKAQIINSVIYANCRTCIMHFAESLELFFRFRRLSPQIRGNLSRNEKAQIINLFVNRTEVTSHLNMNILCATPSGVRNAGIDSSKVRLVVRLGFPPSIMDTSQDNGRVG